MWSRRKLSETRSSRIVGVCCTGLGECSDALPDPVGSLLHTGIAGLKYIVTAKVGEEFYEISPRGEAMLHEAGRIA